MKKNILFVGVERESVIRLKLYEGRSSCEVKRKEGGARFSGTCPRSAGEVDDTGHRARARLASTNTNYNSRLGPSGAGARHMMKAAATELKVLSEAQNVWLC
ncbi:hypothetical protein EVAR_16203_1 [Eumeta japonica]|uniref:Uncharacterized protein n=1 Tax=Eumeta variegata TaxID=151549 RepID=A0A4C1U6C9_EUMVA|nr:hypothetical protein EVAR_16203_1 [Eumeta japonica]